MNSRPLDDLRHALRTWRGDDVAAFLRDVHGLVRAARAEIVETDSIRDVCAVTLDAIDRFARLRRAHGADWDDTATQERLAVMAAVACLETTLGGADLAAPAGLRRAA